MTPHQTLIVAALGGLAALLGLVLIVALALGLYTLIARLIDLRDTLRERRAHARAQEAAAAELATLHAIDSLGTTNHPKEQ
jgi:peptidoglycan/LPS O-acetylase OafA/YrhL